MSPRREIGDYELRPSDVPGPEAGWREIRDFADTRNGYRLFGGFKPCAALANGARDRYDERGELPDALPDLRA